MSGLIRGNKWGNDFLKQQIKNVAAGSGTDAAIAALGAKEASDVLLLQNRVSALEAALAAGGGGVGFTVSPDGSTVTTVGPILTDTGGNKFALVAGNQFSINSVTVPSSANVVLLLWYGGKMYQQTSGGSWYFAPADGSPGAATIDPRPAGGGGGNTPTVYPWTGTAGSLPDATKWTARNIGTGAGNGWPVWFTNRTTNVQVDGNGNLLLIARRESFTSGGVTQPFTSGWVDSQNKWTVPPGSYVEVPIACPTSNSFNAAGWTQGVNASGQTNWPVTGELDFVETGGGAFNVTNNVHVNAIGSTNDFQWLNYGGVNLSTSIDNSHTYGFFFDSTICRLYINRTLHRVFSAADASRTGRAYTFNLSQFLLFDLAVNYDGGSVYPATQTIGPITVWPSGEPFTIPAVPSGADTTKPF